MRYLFLSLIIFYSVSFADSASSQAQELGVNYNGVFSQIDRQDLSRCKAQLVRGFVDYFEFKDGQKKINDDEGLQKLRDIHNAGFEIILNIKFNFEERNLPVTDSEINSELSYLDSVLNVIYQNCDILVCGNEPFIESKIDQRDSRLSNFYIAAAKKVKSFVDNRSRKVPLYIGAFDNLWKPSWQTEATIALISFANETSWINGIDLHIHHTEMEDIDSAFAFVNPKIRDDQKIIVTEFSLKNEWKLHLRDTIPYALSSGFGRPASWEVYQYLNYTIHNPVSREEWVTFLSKSPWFETRKNYLIDAWEKFNSYPKFYLAAYGMYQNAPEEFTPKTDPWIINPLFVNTTVVRNPLTGQFQTNYAFFDEFIEIMK